MGGTFDRTPTSGSHGGRSQAPDIRAGLSAVLSGISLVFFGLVGAHLELQSVASLMPLAGALVAARAAGVALGAWLGAAAGSVGPALRRQLWRGMLTQAGIALGLVRVVERRFPEWGPALPAVLAGSVLINLLIGPVLFKVGTDASWGSY